MVSTPDNRQDDNLLDDRQTYDVIGAAMDVHRELGCGFLERVYRQPFEMELTARSIPFEREKQYRALYKGSRWRRRTLSTTSATAH